VDQNPGYFKPEGERTGDPDAQSSSSCFPVSGYLLAPSPQCIHSVYISSFRCYLDPLSGLPSQVFSGILENLYHNHTIPLPNIHTLVVYYHHELNTRTIRANSVLRILLNGSMWRSLRAEETTLAESH